MEPCTFFDSLVLATIIGVILLLIFGRTSDDWED
jgi:hypothetical protein